MVCRKVSGGIAMKTLFKVSVIAVMFLIFSSYSFSKINQNSKELTKKNVKSTTKFPTIKKIVNTLCSDEFQGRRVGSKGNERAGEYIAKIFKDIGINPLFGNSYYEKYPQKVYGYKETVETANNIVGVIRGKNSSKAIVISAHFDHLGIKEGKILRGALDNASGVSALIEIAHLLKQKSKEKPFATNIILCAFNGEEIFRGGSQAFIKDIKSKLKPKYSNVYNLNIDCIGAKNGGRLALVNKSKVSFKLFDATRSIMKKHIIDSEDIHIHGVSDNLSFEFAKISNVEIQQDTISPLVHKASDTPDILDYNQINKIVDAICDFVETNDGLVFKK